MWGEHLIVLHARPDGDAQAAQEHLRRRANVANEGPRLTQAVTTQLSYRRASFSRPAPPPPPSSVYTTNGTNKISSYHSSFTNTIHSDRPETEQLRPKSTKPRRKEKLPLSSHAPLGRIRSRGRFPNTTNTKAVQFGGRGLFPASSNATRTSCSRSAPPSRTATSSAAPPTAAT